MNSAVKVLKSSPRPISEIVSDVNSYTSNDDAFETVFDSDTESITDTYEFDDFNQLCPTGDGYRKLFFFNSIFNFFQFHAL